MPAEYDIRRENNLRAEFREILFTLAETPDISADAAACDDIVKRLRALYCPTDGREPFHHFNADIYTVLIELRRDVESIGCETLEDNLNSLRKSDSVSGGAALGPVLRELYDQTAIENRHISYSDGADWAITGQQLRSELDAANAQLQNAQGEIGSVRKELNDVKTNQIILIVKSENELKERSQKLSEDITAIQQSVDTITEKHAAITTEHGELKAELKRQQREYITILGIFAAIVITFTSGVVFSSSVLQSIAGVSIYRLLLVSLVIGLVLINVLYALFLYICSLMGDKTERLKKPARRLNALLLVLIIAVVIGWFVHVVEWRNGEYPAETPVAAAASYEPSAP